MIIRQVETKQAGSELAAKLFAQISQENPDKPIGLATGETMRGVYSHLSKINYTPETSNAFALDEYLGVEKTDPNSYFFELTNSFCKLLNWEGKLHVPGQEEYSGEHGLESFEQAHLELGPLSVQLLGFGVNGHIAFNEPGSELDSLTRVVDLHEETRIANSRFFDSLGDVPRQAYSQGLATIKRASSILLLVFGEQKKQALLESLGETNESSPLSALKDHENLTLITDIQI